MRLFMVCTVALCLAFAPTPLPKRGRASKDVDDLQKLQGKWVHSRGGFGEGMGFEVKGDRLTFDFGAAAFRITLERTGGRNGKMMFFSLPGETQVYEGVYRLEGDKFGWRVMLRPAM